MLNISGFYVDSRFPKKRQVRKQEKEKNSFISLVRKVYTLIINANQA